MYQSLYSEISLLKQQAEYNYSPLYIAKMSMNILNEYSNEIIAEDRDKFISRWCFKKYADIKHSHC